MAAPRCVIRSSRGKLALRFRWRGERMWEGTTLPDTPENRARLEPIAAEIGRELRSRYFDERRYLHYFPEGNHSTQIRARLGLTERADGERLVSEYIDEYLSRVEPIVRRSRLKGLRVNLNQVAKIAMPDGRRVADIALRELARVRTIEMIRGELFKPYVVEQKGEPVVIRRTQKTVKNIIGDVLSAFLTAAEKDELIKENPISKVGWKRQPVAQPDPFTEEERDSLIEHFRTEASVYHAWVVTLFWTGMRLSEATALRWQNIDLESSMIDIRRSRTHGEDHAPKTSASARSIKALPVVIDALRSICPLHPDPDGFVFVAAKGGPICTDRFAARQWRGALRREGIRPRKLYSTRHTFISVALTKGVNLAWIAGYVGNSVPIIMRHYGRWIDPDPHRPLDLLMGKRGESGNKAASGAQRGGK